MTYMVDATVRQEGDAVRHIGKFDTEGEAVAAARKFVDGILDEQFRAGMAPSELFACYEKAGIFVHIFLDHDINTFNLRSFNHYQYALQRCAELCGGRRSD